MKTCKKCNICLDTLPLSSFKKKLRENPNWVLANYNPYCEPCERKYANANYAKHHPPKLPITEKPCTKCKIIQPLSHFHPVYTTKKPTHRSECMSCTNARSQKYKDLNEDKIRAYTARRSKMPEAQQYQKEWERSESGRAFQARQREKHSVKNFAKSTVNNAIRDGRMARLSCLSCGSRKTEAHHEDYSKPLDVIFYCKTHHTARHRELKKMGITWGVDGKPVLPVIDRPHADEST